MRRFDRRYMMAMHCTRKLALEKILGLHYRGFEILSRVFTRPCEISPSKNSHFSTRVEKVRLDAALIQQTKAPTSFEVGAFTLNPAASYSSIRRPYSTIGAGGLNGRVRDGIGCVTSAIATGSLFKVSSLASRVPS